MKLRANLSLLITLILFTAPVMTLQGCGDNSFAPDNSTITIDPATSDLKNIVGDTVENFTVTVRDQDGYPIPYANIKISGAFADPAYASLYQFYWYPDGTQRPGGNVPVDSGFIAQTDKYGVFQFSIVVFGSSVSFNDSIYVTSGTASTKADISLSFS